MTTVDPVDIGEKALGEYAASEESLSDREALLRVYAAIEAAGFRIVGPEATDAQIGAAATDRPLNETVKWARYAIHGIARRFWSVMHATAPKWGDGQ